MSDLYITSSTSSDSTCSAQKNLAAALSASSHVTAISNLDAMEAHNTSNTGDFDDVVLFGTAPWHKERAPHHAIVVVPCARNEDPGECWPGLLKSADLQESSFPPTFFGSTPQMPGIWHEAMRS